ncbi:alpha/beta fold hydrolase [Frankia canadensis]|nr:alpha/beta hydrolase [Frankia canadensis]
MVETRQWQTTGATGLTLQVEELRPNAVPPEQPGPASPGPARHPGEADTTVETDTTVEGGAAGTTSDLTAMADGPSTDDAPITLVHGIAGSAADWAAVAPDLAATRRVIAYDQRGHGASDRTPDGPAGYTFDLLLADLAAVLDAVGTEPVHLVGHSMGGVIALRYTLDHPERVRSLILVDTAAAPATATGPVARRLVGALLDAGAAFLSARHAATATATATAMNDDPPALAHHGTNPAQHAAEGIGQIDPEALATLGRELGTYPSLVDRLGEIRVPTTVIVGEHDTGLRDAAATMAHTIPGAHLAVIAGADHSPQATRPLAWLTAVDDHLARLPTTSHR